MAPILGFSNGSWQVCCLVSTDPFFVRINFKIHFGNETDGFVSNFVHYLKRFGYPVNQFHAWQDIVV